ncbi:MAG: glycosyltransferase [Elusimicrobia bacterium]|nr:glycosyltransferase [Elusimicrobiota bacterium]
MSAPLVSVVIPAFNAERWVPAALESVLAQDYAPLEVIVVDDGSKDGTGAAVARFGDRVRYVRQANSGVCQARNRGAREARGKLVAFLDADDVWLPGKLKAQAARFAARPGLATCFTGTVAFDEATGRETLLAYRLSPDLVADLLLHCTIIGNSSTVMVRREVFERVGGFDPALSNCADWDMWIRLAGAGPVDLVPEPYVRYRLHHGSMSTSVRLLEKDTLTLLEKFFSDPANAVRYAGIRRDVFANQFLVLSGSHLHAGNVAASLRFLALACRARPSAALTALGLPWRTARRLLSGQLL